MDPQAAWNELLCAWRCCQWHVVAELAEALLAWLAKGGFPPETTARGLGRDWNHAVALSVCHFAFQRASALLGQEYQVPFDVPYLLSCTLCGHEGPPRLQQAITD